MMSVLIEGLPNDIAIKCLALVPFYLHPKLELVNHSWQKAIHSSELFIVRQEVNSLEDLLCVCAFDPENLWQLYDPLRDIWITLPFLPSKVKRLSQFGVVSISGKIFVLGGGSDSVDPLTGDHDENFVTNEVWSYDLVSRNWAARTSMLVPRAMFACCVSDGKIVVAGGFTSGQQSILKAEIYDPEEDKWAPLPDLNYTDDTACSGMVIGGKVHVKHEGVTSVQILDGEKLEWTVKDYDWFHGPMVAIQGSLYVMFSGVLYKQDDFYANNWKFVVLAPEFRKRIGFGMVGLGDDLYIIGGIAGPEGWNSDIQKLTDVHVLTIGSEQTIRRQVANMTECNGIILGCTNLRI